MNIHRLLIANRGEIAVRIIRSCEKLGIESILAVSEADRDSMAARMANECILIGPAPSADSYLNVRAIINAVLKSKADAIHPGYGFLSENQALARACNENNIIFIGPTVEQLQAMGDKLQARDTAVEAGLPVVPGGPVDDIASAKALAQKIGYPVLLKAVSGGGGRGMQIVESEDKLQKRMDMAMAEAGNAFADSRVYLEVYVGNGRHVEVQVLGDGENFIHLGTRDCSVQRRYQKLIEEAPAPDINNDLRSTMENDAVALARHLNYRGLGTVELLFDCERETYYFLEMNVRIQVEHPVTEAITGLDLVTQQIRIAEGKFLGLHQKDVQFNGHAIECRINAEDCAENFRPTPGRVSQAVWPAGSAIRVDTHIETGSVIPPYYDSLMGKIIVHGTDRLSAIKEMQKALALCGIDGVHTNVQLHRELLDSEGFSSSAVSTGWLGTLLEDSNFRSAIAAPAKGDSIHE